MEKVQISTEIIKLDQFLKWAGICDMGSQAKELIGLGKVRVNGNIEIHRGKKLRKGDLVEVENKQYQVD